VLSGNYIYRCPVSATVGAGNISLVPLIVESNSGLGESPVGYLALQAVRDS